MIGTTPTDDTISSGEMLRQEKMCGGGSMVDLDREFADRIMKVGKFEVGFVFFTSAS